jgi:hypothetical protein
MNEQQGKIPNWVTFLRDMVDEYKQNEVKEKSKKE